MGRSIKAAFRRLLFNHVLSNVQEQLQVPEPPKFKVYNAVTIYDGVRLKAEAWAAVPKSAVPIGWRKSGVLVPFNVSEIEDAVLL